MIAEDQRDVIALLEAPATHGGQTVERIQTHSAIVFLAGHRAFKLKRAVRYSYLDFSTAEKRRDACEAELRLNRRTAPSIYMGVRPVTRRPDGTLELEGPGVPVDWVVEMVRFDQEQLLDRLANRAALSVDVMPALARAVAEAHQSAVRCERYGGAEAMAWIVDDNAAGFAADGAGILDSEACGRVTSLAHAAIERVAAVLDGRHREGRVRWCHGDLHLRNLVLIDGRPTLFDAVEFNERIACGDVLYDLAFLLMDLWRRRLHRHASVVFNEYLSQGDDLSGVGTMPLFLSCRAAIRAKTSATAAGLEASEAKASFLGALARTYLAMAEDLLRPVSSRIVAIGGWSGTGKSTLAARLAPGLGCVPGAVVLRSDVIRKALAGVSPDRRLAAGAYTSAASAEVYRTLIDRTVQVAHTGQSVIADAVFLNLRDRLAIEAAARESGIPFAGFWLEASRDLLARRIAQRVDDASDATTDVVVHQLEQDSGPMSWLRVDAGGDQETVARQVARELGVEIPP